MRIRELYWRPDRVEHIWVRHGITEYEVEEAVLADRRGRIGQSRPAERDPQETMCEYYGRTEAGRYLMVAMIYLGEEVAMPITAREMTTTERRNKYGQGN